MLGLESGAHRGGRWDRGLFAGLMVLGGMPDFFVGTLLLLGLAVIWPVLPLGGATTAYGGLTGGAWLIDVLRHLALPLTSLVLARLTMMYLLCRNSAAALLRAPASLVARDVCRKRIRRRSAALVIFPRPPRSPGLFFARPRWPPFQPRRHLYDAVHAPVP